MTPHIYNGAGQRVSRKSSDGAWPLRNTDGLTFAEAKLKRDNPVEFYNQLGRRMVRALRN